MHKIIEIFADRAALHTEILALRQQVSVLKRQRPRPSLRKADRVFWVILSCLWPGWRHALVIVRPETVIGWHRKGFRLFWTWKWRRGKPGRPPVSREIRYLVRRMSRENTRWGAPRIHGELLKLGFSISQAAVSKYMVRYPSPPSQSWRTFLTNHADCLASNDFFVVPTATFHLLFGFIVLHHERRQIVHFGVTANPTMAWVAQQIREAFPWGTAPRYLIRDRDCQWRSKKGPPRRCKKGPLGGCGLVPVVHGRAPRATRRALNRLTRRRAREGPVGPRGQAWAGWLVQLAVGV